MKLVIKFIACYLIKEFNEVSLRGLQDSAQSGGHVAMLHNTLQFYLNGLLVTLSNFKLKKHNFPAAWDYCRSCWLLSGILLHSQPKTEPCLC
jgi:hypothetical protein